MADAVMDIGSLGEPEVEEVVSPEGEGGEQQQTEGEPEQQQQTLSPEDQAKKSSRDYNNWLKGLRDADPNNKPFINRARDNESRLFALHQTEPRGIDGVRETYALLDSVQHGELKGADAISALQDVARDTEQADQMIADGDPAIWDLFGDEFNGGLSKLAPTLLSRVQASDPEGFQSLIQPHLVNALKSSELVRAHNAMVDLLEQQPPSYLNPDQKQAWSREQMQQLAKLVGVNGQWLNQQAEKAKAAPQSTQAQPNGQRKADPGTERLQAAERKEQDFHWKTNISPKTDAHADSSFSKLFAPYDKRLRLDPAAKADLKSAFVKGVVAKATAKLPNGQDNPYMKQMGRYRAAKNPDPASVTNYFKVEFDKHAKTIMDGLVNGRYGRFLKGSAPRAQASTGTKGSAPIGPKEYAVVNRPNPGEIDFKHPNFVNLRHQNKWPMKNGKIAVRQG